MCHESVRRSCRAYRWHAANCPLRRRRWRNLAARVPADASGLRPGRRGRVNHYRLCDPGLGYGNRHGLGLLGSRDHQGEDAVLEACRDLRSLNRDCALVSNATRAAARPPSMPSFATTPSTDGLRVLTRRRAVDSPQPAVVDAGALPVLHASNIHGQPANALLSFV
jgi:hypothetical protein